VGVPYVQGSATSKAAAAATDTQTDEARVYVFLVERAEHGATDDEIEASLGLSHQTASARRRGLELKRKVFLSTETRKTRSGCSAGVYVVDRSFVGPDLKLKPKQQPKPRNKELKQALADIEQAVSIAQKEGFVPSAALRKTWLWINGKVKES